MFAGSSASAPMPLVVGMVLAIALSVMFTTAGAFSTANLPAALSYPSANAVYRYVPAGRLAVSLTGLPSESVTLSVIFCGFLVMSTG